MRGTAFDVDALLAWYHANKRAMPWRGHPSPYAVWVSEIMLQQTQVETVRPFFTRFMKRFPTLQALAQADDEAVLKAWEGLGYYARVFPLASRQARGMLFTDAVEYRDGTFGDYAIINLSSVTACADDLGEAHFIQML